jgi:molecular chaperone DnaK (HSP70)
MRLGIDFGTTHTVAALVDRGNYPVVSFDGEEAWPSLIAASEDGELRFGLDAAAVRHEPGWHVLRSFKRLLDDAGPLTEVTLAGSVYRLSELLTDYLARLREDLALRSNASIPASERLETAISVPANASSAQRFLTLDAFTRAGFDVVALLNEPSAAGFEFAHRYRSAITSKREYVLVYDLGGGTFDASLLKMTGRVNEVVTSEGVRKLGGDDFDEAILEHVAAAAELGPLSDEARELLLEECARQKEAVSPSTRRFLLDLAPLGRPPFVCPIEDVYAACAPLVTRTLDAIDPVLRDPARGEDDAVAWTEIAGIYIVGGAGSFPLVPRMLKERWGEKRVKRSPHPFAATAIGLAVHLDTEAGYVLSERLSRHFGVFRETESGGDVVFDSIFPKDVPLPAPGEPPLVATRRYRAAHNIGHFRFLECGRVTGGRPDGDVTPFGDVRFPFDPELRGTDGLATRDVVRAAGPEVEERYTCGAAGAVEVEIRTLDDGFSRRFALRRG